MCMCIEYGGNGVTFQGFRCSGILFQGLVPHILSRKRVFKPLAFLSCRLLYFASLPVRPSTRDRTAYIHEYEQMTAKAFDWNLSAPIERVSRIPRLHCQRNAAAAAGRDSGLSQASARRPSITVVPRAFMYNEVRTMKAV